MKKRLLFLVICLYGIELCSFIKFLYRPEDDVRSILLQLIENERKSLKVAMYTLTDKQVLEKLIRAYLRGIKIEIVVDQNSDSYSQKMQKLKDMGITIFIHRVIGYPMTVPLMHHKFLIFEQTYFDYNGRIVHSGSLAWVGSYNATEKAAVKNDESVIVTDDRLVLMDCQRCFSKLVERLQ